MKFCVEAWAPEYGSPMDFDGLSLEEPVIDAGVERSPEEWVPVVPDPETAAATTTLFTDGVRRVDARVWIESADGRSQPGLCATYAAGAVLCDGRAELVAASIERGLVTAAMEAGPIETRSGIYQVKRAAGDAPEQLAVELQNRMGLLEVAVAQAAPADLVVIDGPLSGRQSIPGAVGLVKTHHVSYLPVSLAGIVPQLAPGQRTPLFLTTGRWNRFSWYLRLPGGAGHPWAGVVRCESSGDAEVADAIALADSVAATLPRYASALHKDPRAPQNLYPIAGMERELRRRLGDPALLYRSLRLAAAA